MWKGRMIKYFYKYNYMGHDRVNIEIGPYDEIADFLDIRYMGPPEIY